MLNVFEAKVEFLTFRISLFISIEEDGAILEVLFFQKLDSQPMYMSDKMAKSAGSSMELVSYKNSITPSLSIETKFFLSKPICLLEKENIYGYIFEIDF